MGPTVPSYWRTKSKKGKKRAQKVARQEVEGKEGNKRRPKPPIAAFTYCFLRFSG